MKKEVNKHATKIIEQFRYKEDQGSPSAWQLANHLRSLSKNNNFIWGLINKSRGHADIHCDTGDKAPSSDGKFSNISCPQDVVLSRSALDEEIEKVACHCSAATHFSSRYDLFCCVRKALQENTDEIASWLLDKDNVRFLELSFDANKFIGSGVDIDGNICITSGARVVLRKSNAWSPVKDGKISFDIKTAYPDIEKDGSGSLIYTGQNVKEQIIKKIETSADMAARAFWFLKAEGYDVEFRERNQFHDRFVRTTVKTHYLDADRQPISVVFDYSIFKNEEPGGLAPPVMSQQRIKFNDGRMIEANLKGDPGKRSMLYNGQERYDRIMLGIKMLDSNGPRKLAIRAACESLNQTPVAEDIAGKLFTNAKLQSLARGVMMYEMNNAGIKQRQWNEKQKEEMR